MKYKIKLIFISVITISILIFGSFLFGEWKNLFFKNKNNSSSLVIGNQLLFVVQKDVNSVKMLLYNIGAKKFAKTKTFQFARYKNVSPYRTYYNPVSGSVIFIVGPTSEGMAGGNQYELLEKPFTAAFYLGSLDGTDLPKKIYSTDNLWVDNAVLDLNSNKLIFSQKFRENNEEIFEFNIGKRKIKKIALVPGNKEEQVTYGILHLSDNGEKVYQVIKREMPHSSGRGWSWIGEKIDLKTIDLRNGEVNNTELISDDDSWAGIDSLSSDFSKIAYFALDISKKVGLENTYKLFLKDLKTGVKTNLPYSGEIEFLGGQWFVNDTRFLYGTKGGFSYYDFTTQSTNKTPINYIVAKSPEGDLAISHQGSGKYIIYDVRNDIIIQTIILPSELQNKTTEVQWIYR